MLVLLWTYLAVAGMFGSYVLPFRLMDDSDRLDLLARHVLGTASYEMYIPPADSETPALHDTYAKILRAAEKFRFMVLIKAPPSPNADGETVYAQRTIFINPERKADARTMILAHEVAHIFQPEGVNHTSDDDVGDEEVFVEAVSYLVISEHANLTQTYVNYLSRYKQHVIVLTAYRQEILAAARFIRGE